MFSKYLSRFSRKFGIDLATSNILIVEMDKGLVVNEPSVVSFNTRTEQVLAVGENAKRMIGKTPAHIKTTRPLSNGIVSDYEITEKMLKYYMDRLHGDGGSFFSRPVMIFGVPLEITEVEKKAVEDAAYASGAGEVYLIHSLLASALGAHINIQEAAGNLVVNIGGGITEIGVVSLGGVVTWKSITIAGMHLDRDIMNYARDQFNLLLGEKVAETIKMRIGSTEATEEDLQFEMRGRDMVTGLPRAIMVSESQIRDAMSKSVRTIVENIKITLENTPPELVADIYERGMVLCGGGALLRGIEKTIQEATAIPVRVTDDPQTACVRGLGILLEDEPLRNDIRLPLSNEGYKL
jgi:rod shape-determining protein MreB